MFQGMKNRENAERDSDASKRYKPNEKMKKQVSLCGEQIKCCNEWPEIVAALM